MLDNTTFLEASSWRPFVGFGCCVSWGCCVLVGVGAASLGPMVVCLSLFGRSSCGLGHLDVLAQDPPMAAVAMWRASGSWWRLGSPLLNDDTFDASPTRWSSRFLLAELPVKVRARSLALALVGCGCSCAMPRDSIRSPVRALGSLLNLSIVTPRQHPSSACAFGWFLPLPTLFVCVFFPLSLPL